MKLKKICKEQYEKDFQEMFKLDKNGLMTDIDCYVSNLENKINNLQSKIDKAIKYIESHKPSDIGICGNKKKYYYTLDEDSVDNLLDILKEDK